MFFSGMNGLLNQKSGMHLLDQESMGGLRQCCSDLCHADECCLDAKNITSKDWGLLTVILIFPICPHHAIYYYILYIYIYTFGSIGESTWNMFESLRPSN